MSDKLPPCDHDECGKLRCERKEMKTAEEWIQVLTMSGLRPLIRIIQLDAMKEGARRAAEIVSKNNAAGYDCHQQHILTTSEKWTEKDL